MKPSYQFIEHTADILFKAKAEHLGQLFEQCALAVQQIQVEVKTVLPKVTKVINLTSKSIERLLFDFLNELLFYKDSEQLLFSRFEVKIIENKIGLKLTCLAFGEKLNPQKHGLKVDAKAITMHLFEVKKMAAGWQATVLVDI